MITLLIDIIDDLYEDAARLIEFAERLGAAVLDR